MGQLWFDAELEIEQVGAKHAWHDAVDRSQSAGGQNQKLSSTAMKSAERALSRPAVFGRQTMRWAG